MEAILKQARTAARLTQQQLAERLGTTQSAVARLESPRSNPRIATLERALRACGMQMSLTAQPTTRPGVDETMIAYRLRLSPGERLKLFESTYADMRKFALAAAQSRGELD
ncbi:MAG: helix-turn-helix domain-containing protein [Solirubrobacteraceae bacterium]